MKTTSESENARRLYTLMKSDELGSTFRDRYKYLGKLEQNIQKALKKAPEGTLRISRIKGSLQYYLRTSPEDTNGRYIPVKKIDLVRRLAQKAYYRKALAAVRKEAASIRRLVRSYPDETVEDIYDSLRAERKDLVIPLAETDEMFVQNWNDVSLSAGAGYAVRSEFYTERGERVRSKSEVLIADHLYRNNIPYRYEYPLYLDGLSTVYPDFTILNVRTIKEYIWEHNGMMDDPEYAEKAVRKICTYELNGYHTGENLILTYETAGQPLNLKLLKETIKRYLL